MIFLVKMLFWARAFVVTLSFAEGLIQSRYWTYNWKSFCVSIFDLIARAALLSVVPISLSTPVVQFAERHSVMHVSLNTWWMLVILFLFEEFCFYWLHRAGHRVRWFWIGHIVHHTPNELNFSVSYRSGLWDKLIGETVFFLPMIFLGFPTWAIAVVIYLAVYCRFWIHSTYIPKLGWLEYILNTSSAHRVHHAANVEYLDANYGGFFIIFDRIFGTYIEERDDIEIRYGLVHPQTSYNPWHIEFDEWIALFKDLKSARGIRSVLGYLFMPPGWKPNGQGETTEDLRRRQEQLVDADTLVGCVFLGERT